MLDQFVGNETPFNLKDLVLMDDSLLTYPESAIKTRSATAALLSSDKSKAVENYQAMVAEQMAGSDNLYKSVIDTEAAKNNQLDMKSVMGVLSDPNIPIEHKRKVIGSINNNKFLSDPSNALFSNSLEATSGNESPEQESVRVNIADSIAEIYKARQEVQGLTNAHAASLAGASITTAGEMAEHWVMPFGNNINTAKLYSAFKEGEGDPSLWNFVKGFLRPGSSTMEMRERALTIPPEKRAEAVKRMTDYISANSGILFSSENDFAQYSKAINILEEGGYNDVDEFLDNWSGLLDIIGIGQAVRSASRASAARRVSNIPNTEIPSTERAVPPTDATNTTGSVRAEKQARAKAAIEEQWAFDPSKPTTDAVVGPTQPREGVSTLLGGTGKRVVEEEPKKKIAALFQRIEINNTVKAENPASPAKIVQQTNPEQSRAIHTAVVNSVDDSLAQGLYGTNKVDAVASDVMPQAAVADGAVITRVPDIGINLRQALDVPEELVAIMHSRGHTEWTVAEKAAVRARVVNDFQAAEGLVINNAMSSFSVDGGRIKIGAVYGTSEGGFLRAEEALAQAKQALRQYAITDDNLEVLAKKGLDHVPVKLEDVTGKDGNYLIRINTFHDIDPTDVVKKAEFDVKFNFFDSFSGLVSNTKGSVSRWILDAASMLHPTYTGAAVSVSDVTARFEKAMLNLAEDYGNRWKSLSKASQQRIDEYIKDANYNGIALDQNSLLANGWSQKEVDAVKAWRKYWDAHFYFENYDLVRTLNAEGYQLFRTPTTELFAKPISKNGTLAGTIDATGTKVVGGTSIFNPAGDTVTVLTKGEIDDLYSTGGTIARLRRPTEFDGVLTEYMIVRNTPNEYLRKVKDTDKVMNYRPGYFQIQYTAPKFVDEIVKDGAGKELYRKAIAVAGDTAEAERFRQRMATSSGKSVDDYIVRGDDRGLLKDSDSWWDVNSARGRIAQRYRGKLLEDAAGLNHLGDGSYIINPVESAVRAARSISGRTISRPMLEAAKSRFTSQYRNLLQENKFGEVSFPNRVQEIGTKGRFTDKDIADARTTWEYINYLENGYINSVDAFYKELINKAANMAAKYSTPSVERALNKAGEGTGGPVSLMKNAVFSAYIGSNVFRQWVIQPHQVIRTVAYNPIGWATGKITEYSLSYVGDILNLNLKQANKDFVNFVERSGFMDNVDKQNLVRGVLRDAADSSSKAARIASTPFNLARQAGFDVGERMNMLGHLSAVYDKYKRAGKDLSNKDVAEAAYSEARAISYDMNFAGDMPYNQTTPALILQFMQVPHKALLQLTNRRIPGNVRVRLLAGDMLFWGTPAYMISDLLGGDFLPDNPEYRDVLVWGLESYALNALFSQITGEDKNIDFSGLAPYDLTGWGKMYLAIREGGLDALISASPAAGLFFKDGSRFENAMHSMGRFMNVVDDDEEDPETFLSVLNEVGKISSGYNNAVKAKLILDVEKRMDQYGSVIEDKAGKLEAFMQLLGFTGGDQRDWYRLSMDLSKTGKSEKEEWDKMYNEVMRVTAEKLDIPNTDPLFLTKVTGRLLKVYEDNPTALNHINRRLYSDLSGKDSQLMYRMLKSAGVPDGLTQDQIKMSPLSDKDKETYRKALEGLEKERLRMKDED